MTQAFNLAQLANNLNTSGQLDATDGLSGLVTNANLASSGSASSSTFLRGDRTWASIGNVGKILQVVQGTLTTPYAVTVSGPGSYYSPGISASITPSSTSSRILVIGTIGGYSSSATTDIVVGLFRGSTQIFIGTGGSNSNGTIISKTKDTDTGYGSLTYAFVDSPSSTSSLTYSTQISCSESGKGIYINRRASDSAFGMASSIIVAEIGA